MYCRHCGNEIPNEARFCPACGEETQQNNIPNNTIAARNGSTRNEPNEITGRNQGPALTEAVQARSQVEASETSTLKAAVESGKKRSRRKIPMIVLVVLSLALAASVAYAAYHVYTDIWVPAQQEQQNKAEKEQQVKEAQQAYDEIIREYRDALNEAQSGDGLPYGDEFTEKYPHVNNEPFSFYPGSGTLIKSKDEPCYKYTTKDLNNDGIPELLIGKDTSSYGDLFKVAIYDIWSFQNHEPINILIGITRGDFSLRENGIIVGRGNGGLYINAFTVMSLRSEIGNPNEEPNNSTVGNYSDSWDNIETLSEDRIDGVTTTESNHPVKYSKLDKNGNVSESGTCTIDQFLAMRDELLEKYPEDTSVSWTDVQTE